MQIMVCNLIQNLNRIQSYSDLGLNRKLIKIELLHSVWIRGNLTGSGLPGGLFWGDPPPPQKTKTNCPLPSITNEISTYFRNDFPRGVPDTPPPPPSQRKPKTTRKPRESDTINLKIFWISRIWMLVFICPCILNRSGEVSAWFNLKLVMAAYSKLQLPSERMVLKHKAIDHLIVTDE